MAFSVVGHTQTGTLYNRQFMLRMRDENGLSDIQLLSIQANIQARISLGGRGYFNRKIEDIVSLVLEIKISHAFTLSLLLTIRWRCCLDVIY